MDQYSSFSKYGQTGPSPSSTHWFGPNSGGNSTDNLFGGLGHFPHSANSPPPMDSSPMMMQYGMGGDVVVPSSSRSPPFTSSPSNPFFISPKKDSPDQVGFNGMGSTQYQPNGGRALVQSEVSAFGPPRGTTPPQTSGGYFSFGQPYYGHDGMVFKSSPSPGGIASQEHDQLHPLAQHQHQQHQHQHQHQHLHFQQQQQQQQAQLQQQQLHHLQQQQQQRLNNQQQQQQGGRGSGNSYPNIILPSPSPPGGHMGMIPGGSSTSPMGSSNSVLDGSSVGMGGVGMGSMGQPGMLHPDSANQGMNLGGRYQTPPAPNFSSVPSGATGGSNAPNQSNAPLNTPMDSYMQPAIMYRNLFHSVECQLPFNEASQNWLNYRIFVDDTVGYAGNAKVFKKTPDKNERALVLTCRITDPVRQELVQCQSCRDYFEGRSYFKANPHIKGRIILVKNNNLIKVENGVFKVNIKYMCCCKHHHAQYYLLHMQLADNLTNNIVATAAHKSVLDAACSFLKAPVLRHLDELN